MEENFEQQEVVKEYFEKQKDNNLTLCICEKDVEWFYADNEWKHIAIKKERRDGEWVECYVLKSKTIHTFGKKTEIKALSFEYFMAYDYLKGRNNATSEYCSSVQEYISDYLKLKNNNENYTLNDYHQHLAQQAAELKAQQEKAMQGCRDCFLWIITVCFALGGATLPIAIFTCPLTWKFINKLKNKKVNGEQ